MTATHIRHTDSTKQAWAEGFTLAGGSLLMIVGVLDLCRGIMAVAKDDVFVNTPNYIFQFNLTSWGWIHVVLGAIAVIVSLGLFRTATWARAAGVIIAGLVIIANFLSMPYYPLWSIVMIAIAGLIIWALCVVRRDPDDFSEHPRNAV